MATTTTNALSLTSSSALADANAAHRQPASVSPRCVGLPPLRRPPAQYQSLGSRTTYCRKTARNVAVMASGESPIAAAPPPPPSAATTEPSSAETSTSVDTSDFLKTVQDTWDKVEDKYAVGSLGAAGFLALWSSAGMISAIDRLPLIPGVFEVVGIGYTGWFAYRNLVFKPDREVLIDKVKNTYKDIIGIR